MKKFLQVILNKLLIIFFYFVKKIDPYKISKAFSSRS